MVRRKKKKKPIVRLEMRWGGLLSFAVVCFCALLWMFLFGIWTGQSVLQGPAWQEPAVGQADDEAKASSTINDRTTPVKPLRTQEKLEPTPGSAVLKAKDSSFYAIQVGAFKGVAGARRAVLEWRAKDYEAFYLPAESTGQFNRVFVGHLAALPAAKKLAADLQESGHLKGFITLVPGNRKCYP